MEDFQTLRAINTNIKDKHVYVVSDIHGNYKLLKKIINDIDLKKDYLFILGDLTARGKEPLRTLELIMKLSLNSHVYITLGNCDQADYQVLMEEKIDRFSKWINMNYLVHDLTLKEFGLIPYFTENQLLDLQVVLYDKYQKYFDFLMNLNHVIITENYVFTHAGVPVDADLKTDNYYTYIHSRDFYKKGHNLDKTVVCGHIPAVIYNKTSFCDDPLVLEKRKMIFMDGAESIQVGGQINVLEFNNGEYVGFKRYQDYPVYKVIKDQISKTHYKGACWPFLEVNVLEKGEDFSLCEIKDTLEVCYIKNEYIEFIDGKHKCIDDCPANFVDVRCGYQVMLIKKFENYSLVKISGELGFVKNICLGEINEN